jgi:hypothetical protein
MNLAQTSVLALVGLVSLYPELVVAQSPKCETGPVSKTYGSNAWLVYSCDDAKSIAIVSAQGNPAMPFYFILHPKDGTYQLEGEGTGDKAATDAAARELQRLSTADISALINETRAVHH